MHGLIGPPLAAALLGGAVQAAALDCPALEGAALMDDWSGVVFVGENHGTRQIPDAVGRLICRQLEKGRRVHVALEWPEHWTPTLQGYLKASSRDNARQLLLDRTDWMQRQQRFPDGLTSQAMVALLESLRQWRQAGAAVEVSTFDTRQWQSATPPSDVGMAAMLTRNLEGSRCDLAVVLSGEFHTRLKAHTGPVAWPMALLVQSARPAWRVRSIAVRWAGGSLWGCGPDRCGVLDQPGGPALGPVRLSAYPEVDSLGYSAQLYVGTIEASAPWPEAQP